jgi:hypothetical protein
VPGGLARAYFGRLRDSYHPITVKWINAILYPPPPVVAPSVAATSPPLAVAPAVPPAVLPVAIAAVPTSSA